jgi:hypothetical protein
MAVSTNDFVRWRELYPAPYSNPAARDWFADRNAMNIYGQMAVNSLPKVWSTMNWLQNAGPNNLQSQGEALNRMTNWAGAKAASAGVAPVTQGINLGLPAGKSATGGLTAAGLGDFGALTSNPEFVTAFQSFLRENPSVMALLQQGLAGMGGNGPTPTAVVSRPAELPRYLPSYSGSRNPLDQFDATGRQGGGGATGLGMGAGFQRGLGGY